MTKVLIVDQFCGLTPYYLQKNPTPFDTVVKDALQGHIDFLEKYPYSLTRAPELTEVEDTFYPEMCTTVIREGKDGLAEVWLYKWDSSG